MVLTTDPRYIKTEYNSEQAHLISLGIQFYIAGRVSYLYCMIDSFLVVPLLFRHAIEYFLKGYLSFDHKMPELKKYGHNLKKLWEKFKAIENDNALIRFNDFIEQFNNTEYMRYPKGRENLKQGQKEAYEIVLSLSFDETVTDIEPNAISWSINTVDEIVYLICKRMRSPVPTVDWIKQRYSKNDVLFSGNRFFKKSQINGPLTIKFSTPPISD